MMMLVPPYGPEDLPELTAEEIEAMAETVSRVRQVVAEIAARERERSRGLMEGGRLSRAGLDHATSSLGIPEVSDQEWDELQGGSG